MLVADNIKLLKQQIPENVLLVAVSKLQTPEVILEAYSAGQRHFGENKVQELVAKYEVLPKDIQWHFIGHLQTNKVKQIAPFVSYIHSVDSIKLFAEINKQASQNNRSIKCLLQFHIAEEDSKFGFSYNEATSIIESAEFSQLSNLIISGVMGMASYSDDTNQITSEFKTLFTYYNLLKSVYFKENSDFKEISMGMSGDWQIALHQGATMLRIGTSVFGERIFSIKHAGA